MPKSKRRREESEREDRIASDIMVDAYNETEKALGWYCYLQEQLSFPFAAKCRHVRESSPLRVGETVSVIGLAKEDLCMSEVLVRIMAGQRSLAVPLHQLEPMAEDGETLQGVADWHYWTERGYQF